MTEQTRVTRALNSDTSGMKLRSENPSFPDYNSLMAYDTVSETWGKSLGRSFRNHLELAKVFGAVSDVDSRVYEAFDTRITPYIAQMMDKDNPNCPIRLQYMPETKELTVLPFEVEDSLGEDHDTIEGTSIVHRYPNRVLFLVHNVCGAFCRYCTRKRFVSNTDRSISKQQIDASIDYLASNTKIEDCLLSGGDPLLLQDSKLNYILQQIRSRAPHVRFLRIGTRLPVQLPTRLTSDLCRILEDNDVQMMNIHVNHPKEITPLLAERLKMVRKAGVMLGNQSVLLKGVNDDIHTLRRLCMDLVSIGVRPYYVYSCDKAEGNSHFYVPLRRMLELYSGLRGWISGPAVPTFIVDAPGGGGKMPVQPDYVVEKDGEIVFQNYEGLTGTCPNLK